MSELSDGPRVKTFIPASEMDKYHIVSLHRLDPIKWPEKNAVWVFNLETGKTCTSYHLGTRPPGEEDGVNLSMILESEENL